MPEPQIAQIMLRPATVEDCRRVWEWRNDPENRRLFLNSNYIPFKDHKQWFSAKIQASDARIFVAVDARSRAVGYVRFSILKDQAEISIALEKTERGKGYGTAAIKQGSDQLLATGAAKRIVAQVKHDNTASIAAFQRAGFTGTGVKQVVGSETYEMIYEGEA